MKQSTLLVAVRHSRAASCPGSFQCAKGESQSGAIGPPVFSRLLQSDGPPTRRTSGLLPALVLRILELTESEAPPEGSLRL